MVLRQEVINIIKQSKTIAVVGMSTNPEKDAHQVPKYLKEVGYKIIPVNPNADEILGEKSYASLEEIPVKVDIVDIFRPSDETPSIVESAVKLNPQLIWLQLRISHKQSKRIAEDHGIPIVMDKCMMIEHKKIKARSQA
ncbi:MAG: CoA-binding protein [Candidatus Lokiarchaeota archaeon]|nr:CoA-binding protein [Candidatus Lokiarchaeota archaeon]